MKRKFKEVLVELKPSSRISGEAGVFAFRDIKKHTIICPSESDEEDFISKSEFATLDKKLQNLIVRFTAGRPEGFLMEKDVDFNDLGISYFINHSCEGNIGFDKDGDFIAIRDIEQGEELFYDYGLIEANPEFKFNCQCGTASCRKTVTGLDWKKPEFQKQNNDYIYPDLRKMEK